MNRYLPQTMENDAEKKCSELSLERTNYSEDRTLLSNERTFASWVRTAFGAIALGLGFQAVFREVELTWVAKGIATLFILLGVWLVWNAERRAGRMLKERSQTVVQLMSDYSFRKIAIAVTVGALALVAAVWTML